jgi:hypothetical protein
METHQEVFKFALTVLPNLRAGEQNGDVGSLIIGGPTPGSVKTIYSYRLPICEDWVRERLEKLRA